MDPRYYRLGNLLREVNSDKIVEVIGLQKMREERITPVSMPHVYYNKYSLEVSGSFEGEWQAEEIPITEELLFKIGGYSWDNKIMINHSIDFCEHPSKNGSLVCFIRSFSHGQIKFLHQLQNLYFSLTGEELNVSVLNPEPIPNPND